MFKFLREVCADRQMDRQTDNSKTISPPPPPPPPPHLSIRGHKNVLSEFSPHPKMFSNALILKVVKKKKPSGFRYKRLGNNLMNFLSTILNFEKVKSRSCFPHYFARF